MKFKIILFTIFYTFQYVNAQVPISLHPDNPHYFLFRSKPTILITSAEHYGMVLNAELDYKAYLEKLQDYGFNQTRIFSGVYCEGIDKDSERGRQMQWDQMQNTLAPRPNRLLTPWQRSGESGYYNGGNKFDLDKWDETYFNRLKDFCREAGKRDVVVEVVLFTAIYTPEWWLYSPLNVKNNINGIGDVPYNEFHLLKHKSLVDQQLRMVRKIVEEVNEFDNIYFEICNEPYWLKGIPQVEESIREQQFLPEIDEWQGMIAGCITDAEESLPKKHLIAQNIANSYYKITTVIKSISILNFHYAFPPSAVTDNYHLNLPVAFDETSGGTNAPDRRKEAWAFIMAGGAEYSNLDWSFSTDDMTGLGRNPSGRRQSGREVREQLAILKSTIEGFDFIHASPIGDQFRNEIPEGISLYGLMMEGKDYILYWLKNRKTDFGQWTCPLPAGKYEVIFIDPLEGKTISRHTVNHSKGELTLELPSFSDDLQLRITLEK
ncbi:MAG TPA: hypothetical protein VI583_09450 [Cyclobacteriaceae bacterium]|nr:hypothetical protein [Cyclobacteriaceae bacterium]